MRTIDLFAGCGGLSLGFQNAGYQVLAAFDNWEPAAAVYRLNFDHPIHVCDLTQSDSVTLILEALAPEVIIGGPPCQDFSSAGKRDDTQGRADLTLDFAHIITQIHPTWFVMENVDLAHKSRHLKAAKVHFKQAGYGLSEAVLNASLCGVPQNRKRYFLVGELGGMDDALLPYYRQNLAATPMTVFDYLGNSLGVEYYYRHPRSYARRAVFSIYEPSPTIRGVNRPVPATYKPHPGDAAPLSAALRPLTTLERSYIQTFPRDFVFTGSKTDLEQMIGNAVPVKLAEFVGRCLMQYKHDQENGVFSPKGEALQPRLL
jgi:DNA (cytosine-5)-methyltransferase 1